MFERFIDDTRMAMVIAQEEGRLLNHNYVGTEHILLGLLGERAVVPPNREDPRGSGARLAAHLGRGCSHQGARDHRGRGGPSAGARPVHSPSEGGPGALTPRGRCSGALLRADRASPARVDPRRERRRMPSSRGVRGKRRPGPTGDRSDTPRSGNAIHCICPCDPIAADARRRVERLARMGGERVRRRHGAERGTRTGARARAGSGGDRCPAHQRPRHTEPSPARRGGREHRQAGRVSVVRSTAPQPGPGRRLALRHLRRGGRPRPGCRPKRCSVSSKPRRASPAIAGRSSTSSGITLPLDTYTRRWAIGRWRGRWGRTSTFSLRWTTWRTAPACAAPTRSRRPAPPGPRSRPSWWPGSRAGRSLVP